MNKEEQKTIFIVEDNVVYAEALQRSILIHFRNVRVKIFHLGELCLKELYRNPSIVIMDYFLNSRYEKAQNGLEIIKSIKQYNSEINIIVLSSQEKYSVMVKAVALYKCPYIQKDEEAFEKIAKLIKEFI